jgi:hypothetical protein
MAKSRSAAACTALLLLAACAWPSADRQLLIDFFQACRVYDTVVLSRLATASCNPVTDGIVQDFDIVRAEDAGASSGARAREITLDAGVRPPGGSTVRQQLSVRLEQIEGRWMVAAITRPPALRTLPAASSARPN